MSTLKMEPLTNIYQKVMILDIKHQELLKDVEEDLEIFQIVFIRNNTPNLGKLTA